MSRRLNYRLLVTAILIVACGHRRNLSGDAAPHFCGRACASTLSWQCGRRHRFRRRPDPRQQDRHRSGRPYALRFAGTSEIQSGLGRIDRRRLCVRDRRRPPARCSRAFPWAQSPFALDFSPDGNRAYVAASGSATLVAIDCSTGQIVARARTGRHPWLARVTPDGKQIVVPNREDSTVQIFDAATLASLATIGVASHPEQVVDHAGQFRGIRFRHRIERSFRRGSEAARAGCEFATDWSARRNADEAGRRGALRQRSHFAWP